MTSNKDVLVVAETRQGAFRAVTWELVAAGRALARETGGRLVLAVIDAAAEPLAREAEMCGAEEILSISTPGGFEANLWQFATESVITNVDPLAVLTGYTVDAMGFAPAVAARLGLGFASDVIALNASPGLTVRRGAYSDKLVAQLSFPGKEASVIMVRPGAFTAEPAGSSPASVRQLNIDATGRSEVEHLGFIEAPAGGVDITKADFLLSVGRGIQDEDNLPQFTALAEALGATLSVSRPLVDAGWVEAARQVGQSGKTVKPRVYLALGISGAIQHLAGIREAEVVIAVNTDPEAPIFGVADFGVVADLFDIADALESTLG